MRVVYRYFVYNFTIRYCSTRVGVACVERERDYRMEGSESRIEREKERKAEKGKQEK